jgi:phosphoribosyl-ATP pyrophosphohydrolase/phosphoribosyl-AMP cyclohydrolase
MTSTKDTVTAVSKDSVGQGRKPNFAPESGLIPAVVQHAVSREVLMVGYMNQEALQATVSSGRVTFFSRSKGRLWQKGESSGNFLDLVEYALDCDGDTVLIKAIPAGPTCHTGDDTCFGESIKPGVLFLEQLSAIIAARQGVACKESYTSELLHSGIDRIAQKVGEEAVEVVIEAKNGDDSKLLGECADLLYHLAVLLEHRGLSLKAVCGVLEQRHRVQAK